MIILDGKKISDSYLELVKRDVSLMQSIKAKLCIIQVGCNEASNVYVRNKVRACNYVGIEVAVFKENDNVSESILIKLIHALNEREDVTGILVQLPLPKGINVNKVLDEINPLKDVDGFHPINIGSLVQNRETKCLYPCTPLGIMEILKGYHIEVDGKNCVVVGRSNIVGKPISMMLLNANGTVTTCHSHTKNLKDICKKADILICAIGSPKFFNHEYVKKDAVVIDVGIHRMENGKLCGDVDFDDVKDIVSAITPVPKGVGAMTVAMLIHNCVVSATELRGVNKYEC